MKNILLIGFMGCGKTNVGKMIAARLGKSFIDTDELIESRWERPIGSIISQKGEAFYRKQEGEALKSLLGKKNIVVATGGGEVDLEETWNRMRQIGLIVYISNTPAILADHIEQGQHHEWLDGTQGHEGILERVKKMLDARHPQYYRADIIVEAGDLTYQQLCDHIVARVP